MRIRMEHPRRKVDAFDKEPPLKATPHHRRQGAFLFKNPFGFGDVCAAGLLPMLKTASGELSILLPEEDMNASADFHRPKVWVPALGLFGGKVDQRDTHWQVSMAREVQEELGGLLSPGALRRAMDFDPRQVGWPRSHMFSTYLPSAKYQVLYYPVPWEDRDEWAALPQRYEAAFGGTVSSDLSRSATKLHWVGVQVRGGQPSLSEILHECAPGPEACATRCGQTLCSAREKPLPIKRELQAALACAGDVMTLLSATPATPPRSASPEYDPSDSAAASSNAPRKR